MLPEAISIQVVLSRESVAVKGRCFQKKEMRLA